MGTQVSEVKKILRQQMREAMAEMTEQEKAWSDRELVSAFLAHPKLDEANTVMLYYGVGQEIATADPYLLHLLPEPVRTSPFSGQNGGHGCHKSITTESRTGLHTSGRHGYWSD